MILAPLLQILDLTVELTLGTAHHVGQQVRRNVALSSGRQREDLER